MSRNRQTFFRKVKAVLQYRKYQEPCYPLDDIAQIIDDTSRNIESKVFFYKWLGMTLLVLIPLIATTLSIVLAETKNYGWPTQSLSYSLTFLTLLNSIFKPGERFRQVCLMGIEVSHFKDEFLAELEKLLLKGQVEETQLLEFIDIQSHQFEPYQEKLIGLFFPEPVTVSSKPEVAGDAGKNSRGPESRAA
jgi:hypothetical protein